MRVCSLCWERTGYIHQLCVVYVRCIYALSFWDRNRNATGGCRRVGSQSAEKVGKRELEIHTVSQQGVGSFTLIWFGRVGEVATISVVIYPSVQIKPLVCGMLQGGCLRTLLVRFPCLVRSEAQLAPLHKYSRFFSDSRQREAANECKAGVVCVVIWLRERIFPAPLLVVLQ